MIFTVHIKLKPCCYEWLQPVTILFAINWCTNQDYFLLLSKSCYRILLKVTQTDRGSYKGPHWETTTHPQESLFKVSFLGRTLRAEWVWVACGKALWELVSSRWWRLNCLSLSVVRLEQLGAAWACTAKLFSSRPSAWPVLCTVNHLM